jgi:hypothetical protein
MEASFNPPRHLFKNHDNFDDKLENQHESLKRIATICENLSECDIKCDKQAVTLGKPKRKTKNTK